MEGIERFKAIDSFGALGQVQLINTAGNCLWCNSLLITALEEKKGQSIY